MRAAMNRDTVNLVLAGLAVAAGVYFLTRPKTAAATGAAPQPGPQPGPQPTPEPLPDPNAWGPYTSCAVTVKSDHGTWAHGQLTPVSAAALESALLSQAPGNLQLNLLPGTWKWKHSHTVTISESDKRKMSRGESVFPTTSYEDGHSHELMFACS